MLNKYGISLILTACFVCNAFLHHSVEADELKNASDFKKYNLSICAIFKNEAKYLTEWIEYHRLVGVDHFYLYNIASRDSFQQILRPYINEGLVTLMNWPEATSMQEGNQAYMWALSTQIPAYENAANFKAKPETKWLVFLDIDEFLVCPKGSTISELLKKYEDYPGISLSFDFFDAAKRDAFSQRKLLIETLDIVGPPKQNIDKSVAKVIFKPDFCNGFLWPPYQPHFKNLQASIAAHRQELRINHYMNRNMGYLLFGKAQLKLDVDNRLLSEAETAELLEEGYAIEDQDRAIYQHVPELLKKMGREMEWGW